MLLVSWKSDAFNAELRQQIKTPHYLRYPNLTLHTKTQGNQLLLKVTLKFLSFLPVIIVIRFGSDGEPINDRLSRGTIRHDNHRRWSPVRGGGRRTHDDRSIMAERTNWHDSMKEKQFLSPKQIRRAWEKKSRKVFIALLSFL